MSPSLRSFSCIPPLHFQVLAPSDPFFRAGWSKMESGQRVSLRCLHRLLCGDVASSLPPPSSSCQVTAGGLAEYKYNPHSKEEQESGPPHLSTNQLSLDGMAGERLRPTLRICLWKQHYWSTCALSEEGEEVEDAAERRSNSSCGQNSATAASDSSVLPGDADQAEEDGDVWG
eukprot:767173-Hanusia_phi.AAC.2